MPVPARPAIVVLLKAPILAVIAVQRLCLEALCCMRCQFWLTARYSAYSGRLAVDLLLKLPILAVSKAQDLLLQALRWICC
jgi:hypothetical protein